MADFQWVMPTVAAVAVIATIYFGNHNLRNVITQRERDSGYASGRVEAKLENLEQLVRVVNENLSVVNENLREVNAKLDAHDVKLNAHDALLRQIRREAKKHSRRLRKLRKRVEVLESSGPVPPTDPTSGGIRQESAAVISREGPRLAAVAERGPVERSDRTM